MAAKRVLGLSVTLVLAALVAAQSSTSGSTATAGSSQSSGSHSATPSTTNTLGVFVVSGATTISDPSVAIPTGDYVTSSGQVIGVTTLNLATGSLSSGNSSTSRSDSYLLVGHTSSSTRNGTISRTSSTAIPTNTTPCNGYPEFCNRRYSNITEVTAHNSALVRKNNAFSNQDVQILGQLNDGIRMIQGEVHYVNGSLFNCHSSCDYLNTGPYEDTLITVREWVQANPYDVVTLLIVNSNYANVTAYESAFQDSGILDYVYLPPRRPMRLSDWPTLGQMILSGKRVVVMMDYMANPDVVPYIMDEFSNMWETPFSPTDINFPCTQQRPPGLSHASAENDFLYLANHNLDVEISLGGSNILIPNFASLDLVNANNDSTGSLLTMTEGCTKMWNRPPKWLLVDFYDDGSGSVFEVAAKFNNVTYTGHCCGKSVGLTASTGECLSLNRWTLTTAAICMAFAFGAWTL